MKSTLLLLTLQTLPALSLPGPLSDTLTTRNDDTITYYTGPTYTLPPSELAKLDPPSGSYTPPPDMPIIPLPLGGILSFNSTPSLLARSLHKRFEFRRFTAYNQWGCNAPLATVQDFGCGTGCVSLPTGWWGWSGLLEQGDTSNPYPTANLFQSTDCSGKFQKIGINGYTSCTGDNQGGYRSFIAYYGC
ncbi:hypothetical protein QBC34DRAFT_429256 [Podospora aff. communis PSN243]|uniref:Uncharacterized protein n=1 Tax=Podospora aff. communis PSN243 TaxID=3040156 RepID=A0AAV9GB67_9PEZI|nr:hypothetical protein QBC34DRAFT_429256 [Podospora aff. communis PSN243]